MTMDKTPRYPEDGPCYRSIMLVGPPGAGKGTQGKLLSQIPCIFHISSGDMFRQLDENSELGQLFQQFDMHGDLVPDQVTIKIWREYVETKVAEKAYNPESDLLVLDGIPRDIEQAELIAPYINVLKIIYMVCEDREVMFKRIRGRALKEDRQDDTDEAIVRHRWEVYKEKTEPLIDYYPQELIRIVDADRIPAEVLHDILGAVVPLQKKYFSPAFLL